MYRGGLARLPDDWLLMETLGDCLRRQSRIDEATEYYDRALGIQPKNSELRLKRLLSLPTIVNSREHIQQVRDKLRIELDQMLEDPPEAVASLQGFAASTFNLPYHGLNDVEFQRDIARLRLLMDPSLEFTADHCRDTAYKRPSGRRLRIGFISRMFYGHTIAKLTAGLMKQLDGSKFAKTVFTFRRLDDPWRYLIKKNADEFVELPGKLTLARAQIAAKELDVLFYPDIGMDMTTYHLAFARLAPVQCVSWGHPVTTGIPAVDYFISSESLEPADADGHYTEKLVRLKHLPTYYYNPEVSSEGVSRAAEVERGRQHLSLSPKLVQNSP